MILRSALMWGTSSAFLVAVGCSSSSDNPVDQSSGSAGSADSGGASGSSAAAGTSVSGGAGEGGSGGSASAGGKGGSSNGGDSSGGGGAGGSGGTGTGGSTAGGAGWTVDAGGRVSYTTDFDLTESPISEGGAWKNVGLDWTFIETGSGNAYGTQPQPNKMQYDDSYAHLSGFPANYAVSAVIHRAANIDGSCTHEVEILLRWSDDTHDSHGYECNLAWDGGYSEIVRWNGKINDFTYLTRSRAPMGVKDGDTMTASIVGNLIKVTLNGVEIARATDATFATGNPGMAFWRGGACGVRGDYGFTHYEATSLP